MPFTLVAPLGDAESYATFSPEKYEAGTGDPSTWQLGVVLTAPAAKL